MKNGSSTKWKRLIVVLTALVLGMIMPYLSRLPLAMSYGTPWIWDYISSIDDFFRWNGGQIVSLLPIAAFGALYIFTNFRWSFYASVLGHFAATSFVYHDFGVRHGPDDFLGCLVFPPIFAAASIAVGFAGLVVDLIAQSKVKNISTNDTA